MRRIVFPLLCLACVSQGRRLQASDEQLPRSWPAKNQQQWMSDDSNPSLQSLAQLSQASERVGANSPNAVERLGKMVVDALSSKKKRLQLKYFDIKGAAETARLLLALGGEEYDDTRYEVKPGMQSPDFQAAKESGELKMNLNRVPILITDKGVSIGQSKAIERFLARRFGLMGKTTTEAALIDSVAEDCRDVKDAAMRKGFSAFARGKTDEEKAAAKSEWFSTDLPTFLKKIDDVVTETGSPGFAVGSSLSYADVSIFALLRDGFEADKEDTLKAAAKCSALNAIADNVQSHPSVAKYLAQRPESMF